MTQMPNHRNLYISLATSMSKTGKFQLTPLVFLKINYLHRKRCLRSYTKQSYYHKIVWLGEPNGPTTKLFLAAQKSIFFVETTKFLIAELNSFLSVTTRRCVVLFNELFRNLNEDSNIISCERKRKTISPRVISRHPGH